MYQHFMSLALMVWDDVLKIEEKDPRVNQLMDDGGVCRTATAPPGLLIKFTSFLKLYINLQSNASQNHSSYQSSKHRKRQEINSPPGLAKQDKLSLKYPSSPGSGHPLPAMASGHLPPPWPQTSLVPSLSSASSLPTSSLGVEG